MANKQSFIHDFSVDVRKTNAILVPAYATRIGVMVPDIDAANVGIEVYESGTTEIDDITAASLLASSDTDWNPVLDSIDGADVIICASGSDPGFIEITLFVGSLKEQYIRFTMDADQDEDHTWWLYFK